MSRASFSDDPLAPSRDSYHYPSPRDPYGYPTSSSSTPRESKWDVSEYSLRPSARGQETASSSSPRPRSRSRSSRPPKAPKSPRSPRDMPRKRQVSGGKTSPSASSPKATDTTKDVNTFSVSPASLFSNLQSAYNAFQSLPNLTSAPVPATSPGGTPTSFELNLPDTPVTNLLNPKYLHIPASQTVLQNRLAANLSRHGNAYVILLVGTLLTSHWLVLAAMFGVVKFGFFIQSYNGRDIARDLGVRQYTSSQGIMSGFAAAAALVGLWAFSSLFSVVLTLVKVACLVLLHAAFFEMDGTEQRPQGQRKSSGQSVTSVPPPPPTQNVLRPAGTSLSPRDAVAWAGQQLRSASEGYLVAQTNGWHYAGEGHVGGTGEEYSTLPRTPRSYEQPSPRREEYEGDDGTGHWGYYESGRPQSYASGRSY
ncbi:hypothetical protein CTRI78_v002940 [Colletotrichum trifolii]|uniref:PRA1 family protein n=1 Tax=Colletotrichum trifolii TaxID=5466 RepID=A0A4R8RWP9_COLTR|nr:hypothetical protein CTRI78_v002940 [Colletotrichum trifolii]